MVRECNHATSPTFGSTGWLCVEWAGLSRFVSWSEGIITQPPRHWSEGIHATSPTLTKSAQIGSNQLKLAQIGPNQLKSAKIGSNCLKSAQIGSNRTKSAQIG